MKKWLINIVGICVILLIFANPDLAAGGLYGRAFNVGYLTGQTAPFLDWVFVPTAQINYDGLGPGCALPASCTVTLASFLQVYNDRLHDNSSIIDRGRAAAEINIMLNQQGPSFGTGQAGINKGIQYADSHFAEWANLVTAYASGKYSGYWVNFNDDPDFSNDTINGMGIRSAKQAGDSDRLCTADQKCIGDIAFTSTYKDNSTDFAVRFHFPGNHTFTIKHKCANLTGDDGTGLAIPGSYSLQPNVNVTDNTTGNSVAEVGDTVTFTYAIKNAGNMDSDPATCTLYSKSFSGYHQTPSSPPYDTTGNRSAACNNTVITAGTTTTIKTEAITLATANADTTICRTLSVDPATGPPPTGTRTAEACIIVASQPYFRVYGGDISTGNAQNPAVCNPFTNDYNAAITSWNTGNSLFQGAGAQFAALAIGPIYSFASSQSNNALSSGKVPNGMSFTDTLSGNLYGGNLGAGELPCMSNYYVIPSSAQNVTTSPCYKAFANTLNLSCLPSGVYTYTGKATLQVSGNLSSGAIGTRIQLFSDANVYIPNNIVYTGNWPSIASIPSFELVAGNSSIYISNNVSELDGTYVAQNSQANGRGIGGQIASCATSTGPVPLDSNLFSNCNTQLIVNGAFVADDIVLERSTNTTSESTGDNPSTLKSLAAEQFNYNPSLWMAQPPPQNSAPVYSTISDLPPVL
jgi:hypothetical protein